MFVASASKFRVMPPSSRVRPSRLVSMVKRKNREIKVIRVNVGYLRGNYCVTKARAQLAIYIVQDTSM